MIERSNPVAHFARLGLPFPKSLLGYQPPAVTDVDHKTSHPASPRPNDIPPDYLEAHAVHICPLDYLTVSRLSSTFRQASVTTLTLDPSAAFMTGKALEDVRILLQGLTAFLPSEEELRALFWGRTDDLWQMAEALGEFGCEFIIIKRGARGQMLYDSVSKKRWEIPAYPAHLTDATGAGDSFCGGFLAGYQKTYDPLRGVLHGCVSASLTIEGSGVFNPLEALPGLAQRRLESLTGIVRQI
jgi:sugar/nucleoside kinase (ribokinase family)